MEEIRIASFNCWSVHLLSTLLGLLITFPRGLKYVSKDRHERIAAIASAFSRSNYDIIGLQEVWVQADYNQIRDKVSHRLPYTKLFHRYVPGNVTPFSLYT